MFALHETTQRRVCRVTFLTVCVLPTLLALGWVAYWHRPWRTDDWQCKFTQRLHVQLTLDRVTAPSPGIVSLKNLSFADLRTGELIGEIDSLRTQRESSRQVLRADHLEIQAQQLPRLVAALATWITTGELESLDFHAEQLTIFEESLSRKSLPSVRLTEVSIHCDTSDSQRQRFRLQALDADGEELQLVLENENESLQLLLNAQKSSLPAWLLGKLVPGISSCETAQFWGRIEAVYANRHWRGKLRGVLKQIDLQVWMGDDSPHQLQGMARAELEQLTWAGSQIKIAQGSIRSEHGVCSQSLLQNATQILGCEVGHAWSSDERVSFDRLALNFQLSEAGFAFVGQCEKNALLVKERTPLLHSPGHKAVLLPMGKFVRLLDYLLQPSWLPATHRSHALAEKLPLPAGAAHGSDSQHK